MSACLPRVPFGVPRERCPFFVFCETNTEKQKNNYDIYVNKFKTAFYGFFLFITLSLPVAYKIIDMIAKIISNNIELYDLNTDEPSPLGRVVMGLIFFVLIFIL